jgi:hypothetical protein
MDFHNERKTVNSLKKIYAWEPWFFIFFGLFHMHRIWGLIHRKSYADFWLGVLAEKGFFYFALMGLLAVLCVLGMVVFFRHLQSNFWWRWIYLFGGGYLLFDLFAIAIDLKVWSDLLAMMFDVGSPLWNLIWGFFVLLGAFVLGLGICLLRQRREQAKG